MRRIATPVTEYKTRLVRQSPFLDTEQCILPMLAKTCIRSEFEYFKIGLGLRIPYSILLDNLRETFSVPPPPSTRSHSDHITEAGLRLLRLARNAYFDSGMLRNLKYFYRVLLPHHIVVPLQYFEKVSAAMQDHDEKMFGYWDCLRSESPWMSDDINFVFHLFHLVSSIVARDYAANANHRSRLFGGNGVPHYAEDAEEAPTLEKEYGSQGLVNSFFIRFDIVGGKTRLLELLRDFHRSIFSFDLMIDPPIPDMRMIAFHGAMRLLSEKYEGRVWDFADAFADACTKDVHGMVISRLLSQMKYWSIVNDDELPPLYHRNTKKKQREYLEKRFTTRFIKAMTKRFDENSRPLLLPGPYFELKPYYVIPVAFSWDPDFCFF